MAETKPEDGDILSIETLRETGEAMIELKKEHYENDDWQKDPMTLLLMAYREMIDHPHCQDLVKPLMRLIHKLEEKMVEAEESSGPETIDVEIQMPESEEYEYSARADTATQKVVYQDGDQWCVRSKTGRSFGCYSARSQAEARLAQIESFATSRIYAATEKQLIAWHESLHMLKSVDSVNRTVHDLIEEELEDRGFAPPYTLGDSETKLVMLEKMEGLLPVVKQADQRFTLGPVYVPNVEDAHKEFTDPDTLQQAMWDWVRKGDRTIYLQHSEKAAGEMVEILTFPFEIDTELSVPNEGVTKYKFPANTPFMGVIWEPWAWDLVKSGELRGYSIGGQAKRLEADLPEMALA